MAAVHFQIPSSSPTKIVGKDSPVSDRMSPSASPPSAYEWQKVRAPRDDVSSDEGTLGYQSSVSCASLGREGSRGSGLFKRASKVTLHEKSGLWVMPLSEVDTEAATDMYLNLQSNGLIFKRMGLQGEELRAYARFHVQIGQAEPWNMCAVDDEGKVAGLCIFIRSVAAIDASSLPPKARDHWRIFVELENTFRRRGGVDTSDHLCCTFLGMMPEHQGKGLFSVLNVMQADTAAEKGFTRFWSWTLNPNVIKAMGKGDGAISVASRLGKVFFMVPPWVSNQIIVPSLSAAGLLPKGLRAFWVPLPSLGIPAVEKAGAGLNPLVSANILPSTAVKNAKKANAGKAAAVARAKLMKMLMSVVALLMALWAARAGRMPGLLR
eukprot:Hpha_TRINITY_DN15271_c4_g17::TRINITY_DN15271_c4_g17_i1::g.67412::m.67412